MGRSRWEFFQWSNTLKAFSSQARKIVIFLGGARLIKPENGNKFYSVAMAEES
jgi:hypothetical protein